MNVLVVDSQERVRTHCTRVLDAAADMSVVAQVTNGEEAVSCVREARPEVVVMSVRMPVMDGIEATRRIVALDQVVKVVVLTPVEADEGVFEALRAGASAFVADDAGAEALLGAVRVVVAADALVSPSSTRTLIEDFAARPLPGVRARQLGVLSPRELATLELVAGGLTNAEIADALGSGEPAVATSVNHILAKLGLRDRVHAAIGAYELGLVAPGS